MFVGRAVVVVLALIACSCSHLVPGVEAMALEGVHGYRRSLMQSDALSNSNGCLGSIPKCEQGACAARNVMGVSRWVCLRCLSNYEPVVDASGQDNIIQCVCPKGYFEAAANATSCTRCPIGTFCPGGDKVENPTSRGASNTCGSFLVTRTDGSRSAQDCVAPSGYAMTSPSGGSPCERGSYAPMYNRLAKCLKCQSGLEEPPTSNLTNSQRASKSAVCKVPPGKYVSQGLVRWCPQGFYRENYVGYNAAVAQNCLPCNPGITTVGAGAGSAAECSVVLPGYGIGQVQNVTGPASIPALPQSNTTGLPNATLCAIAYYSIGGFCAQCPNGAITRSLGAKSIEECAVPPGYVSTSDGLSPCGGGFFRSDWVMFSDPRATNCSTCGLGIQSEARDLDENPLAANGSLVRSTSASCFIDAGQGMIARGKNSFQASDCPINTYGAAGKVYGWASAPCKPCPRNMITDGATRVNNSDVCVNDDGFGYASEGASRCAPGFYSAKGSRKPCQRCPFGRTTLDVAIRQRVSTDCLVAPGFGLVSSVANSTDGSGYLSDASGMTDAQAAVVPVLQCPLGYYGAGMALNATCTKCPLGSTTEDVGATSAAQCSICIAGWGQQFGSSQCSPCARGSYQIGGATSCTPCDTSTFYAPVDGVGATWTSAGTTLFTGAIGPEFCVPQETQLSPDAGQAYFSSSMLAALTLGVPQPSLADCIRTCPVDKGCMVQWDGSGSTCYYAALDYDSSDATGVKLKYKLPPASLFSASSRKRNATRPIVRAKMMSSGFYGRLAVTPDRAATWMQAGVPLDAAQAQTFKWGADPATLWDTGVSEADCQRKCDDSVVCVFFLYNTTTSACVYKGGEDALRTRSFFVLPVTVAVPVANGSASAAATQAPVSNNSSSTG